MPLRSRMILFAVIVLILFLGLTAGSFGSLTAASHDAEEAREELAKLDLLDHLECECAGPDLDSHACERARLAAESLAKRGWRKGEQASLARILSLCARSDGGGPVADPAALRTAVAELRRVILSRVGEEIRAAEEPASRRARRLLIAALALAVASSAVFAWLYSRLVRERRALEERLVRSEKLSALATLAAGIAHELNNPLATIAMSAEALAGRLAAGSDDGRYATAIGEEAERCRSIIADLSDLARGASLDLGPVDPLDLAREAARAVARRFPAVVVEVVADPAAKLPLVSADRGKLRQLLVNLLLNGAEASEPGGRVTLSVGVEGARLRFTVKDEGRGIPRHLLDRIFDPFFTGKPKGLGLGLTICHRIAEMHGGELSASSEGPGRGARFTFLLPVEVPRG